LKIISKVIAILFLIFIQSNVNATHIVGGVIYYEYLGGNQYKLIFKIYRDCNAQTQFDGDTFSNTGFFFGVFEGYVDVLQLDDTARTTTILSKIKINPTITNSCLSQNNSCVEEGIYEKIITLPRNDVGYTIIHQRCCRNDAILNIVPLPSGGLSDMPGITLRCFIPPTNTYHNNSAVFKKFPPIFICRDQMFYFDHSAIDKDGDSLKYYLLNPLAGLSGNLPVSANQSLSDNIPIEWQAPYSLSNILGGDSPLTIDSMTGFLSCKPNKNGRFVVSVLVKEIRNGITIDSVVRDFQFNVVDCDIPKADMPFLNGTLDPNTNVGDYLYTFCDTFFVSFKNTSTNASLYKWDFGDTISGANNTSTLFEPTHTYSDTGLYLVKLYVYKVKTLGDTCKDSTKRWVRVFPNFKVDFKGYSTCAGDTIHFNDITTSQYGVTTKWYWDFGDGFKDSSQHPVHSFSQGGLYKVKLYSIDSKLCRDDTAKSFQIYHKPHFPSSFPKVCIGVSTEMDCQVSIPTPDSIADIRWTINNADSNKCKIYYIATNTNSVPIKLYAKSDKGCKDSAALVIRPYPIPTPPVLDSFLLKCKDSIRVSIADSLAISYRWNDGLTDSIRTLSEKGFHSFKITYPCSLFQDTFLIFNNKLEAKFSGTNVCVGNGFVFENNSINQYSTSHWKWNFGDGYDDTSQSPQHLYASAGTYMVKLRISDTLNCFDSFVNKITIYPKPKLNPQIPKLCINVPTIINCKTTIDSPYKMVSYQWDTNGVFAYNTCSFEYKSKSVLPVQLKLKIVSDKGCVDSGIYLLKTHSIPTPFKVKDSYFIHCDDSLLFDIKDSLAIGYLWNDGIKDSLRYINFPGIYKYKVNYPCLVYTDSFKIGNDCSIRVPRAFTPNGDGINDVLYVRGFGVKKLLNFKIFNRLGQLIFLTTDENLGWDGYYKGVLQNTDTYYYTFMAESYILGEFMSGEGNFMLLR